MTSQFRPIFVDWLTLEATRSSIPKVWFSEIPASDYSVTRNQAVEQIECLMPPLIEPPTYLHCDVDDRSSFCDSGNTANYPCPRETAFLAQLAHIPAPNSSKPRS